MTTPPIPFGKSPGALVSGVEPLPTLYTKRAPKAINWGKRYNEIKYG